jgi:thiosulfate reductase cytochrome b subunit
MPNVKRRKQAVKIYTLYERFWHWSQALLIFTLAFTGFGLHGTHGFLDFQTAVELHTAAAILLIVLWLFTTFWNFTTGNWRQFLPRRGGMFAVIKYYAWGILSGAKHPHIKTLRHKQNPLQALAYLTFMILIGPALAATGVVYLLYDLWNGIPNAGFYFQILVFLHTAAAFLMVAFVIIHVYMTTTGKTVFAYIKTMITGVERVGLSEVEEAYLEAEHPKRLKGD